MGITKNNNTAALPKLREEKVPTTLAEIPKVWLVKSELEVKLYPNMKTLDRYPMGGEPRLFIMALAKDATSTTKLMRLSSPNAGLSSFSHDWLWNKARNGIMEISPEVKIENLGGGFIYADATDKTIYLRSKSALGPADINDCILLVKEALKEEYSGYKIKAQVLECHIGDVHVEQEAEVIATID